MHAAKLKKLEPCSLSSAVAAASHSEHASSRYTEVSGSAVGGGERRGQPRPLEQRTPLPGEKPWVCKFEGCAKGFINRTLLARHERTHSNGRPFGCPQPGCGKAFKEKRREDANGVRDNKLYLAVGVALGEMGPESTAELLSWIQHKTHRKDLALQRVLILSLGKNKDEKKGKKALIDLLVHKDAPVQAATAEALAAEIVTRSPDAVAAGKALLQQNWVEPEAVALGRERRIQLMVIAGKNFREALRANFAKVAPSYAPRSPLL